MERRVLKSDMDASLRTQMSDVFTILNSKSDEREAKVWKDSSERQISHLTQEVSRLQRALEEHKALIHTKASVVEVSQALSVKADAAEVDEKMREKAGRAQLAEALSKKAETSDVDLSLGQIRSQMADLAYGLNRKGDASRVQEIYEKCEKLSARVDADSDTNGAALRAISSSFDTALDQLREAATASESATSHRVSSKLSAFEETLNTRMDESEAYLTDQLSRKVDYDELMRKLDAKADLEAVVEAVDEKCDKSEAEALRATIESRLPPLDHRLTLLEEKLEGKIKADESHHTKISATKANVADVNAALSDVCKELEGRATMGLVTQMSSELSLLRSCLRQCGGIKGVWEWKCERVKGGGAVPWNLQSVNTDPTNLIWEQDKTVVVVTSPGLYRIEVGFFGSQSLRPIVSILVEGEVVFTLTSSSYPPSYPALASSSTGGLSSLVKGTSCSEIVFLPPRSRLAVTYKGDLESVQGFLVIQKV